MASEDYIMVTEEFSCFEREGYLGILFIVGVCPKNESSRTSNYFNLSC